MRNPLNSCVETMPASGIRKFFDIVSQMNDPDAISLGVGEPDFDTPWHVRKVAIDAIKKGETFYTSNSGMIELRQEISQYMDQRYQIHYDPKSQILITVGGSEGIDLCIRAMLDPGDEVIIPEPCYVSYKPCVILAGGRPVVIDLKEENEFRLTAQELEKAITPKTKLVLLTYPNNPTGAVMEKEDLTRIAQVIIDHDLFVLSDEIYCELNYTGKPFISIASLPGMAERTVVINGFSKTFAMTGWRLGWAAAPESIISQMLKIHSFVIMCAPTTSQYAAVEALKNGSADVDRMRNEYNSRRKFILGRLSKMEIPCFNALGAFYVFPSIKKFGLSSEEFATRLLKDQKLAVVPGSAFGDCGEGYLRISYAYSMSSLEESLDRLGKFINKLG